MVSMTSVPCQERQLKIEEYRDLANNLTAWLRDATALMQDRNFPQSIMDMRVRFRVWI